MTLNRKLPVQPLLVRALERADLPRVLQIEKETPAPLWTMQNFRADLEAVDRLNLVAVFKGLVVGFAIVRLATESETPGRGARSGGMTSTLPRRALHLSLLHVAVASSWLRQGVGSALIGHLDKHLRKPEDRIQAVVPETSLPVQLLLRSTGFRATRVLRGFYSNEDAYQMERRRAP
jgi:ribosomal protein S18 acetylase RimI-like enzyme